MRNISLNPSGIFFISVLMGAQLCGCMERKGDSSKSGYAGDPENLPSVSALKESLKEWENTIRYEQQNPESEGDAIAQAMVESTKNDIALAKQESKKS